jgi:hypothetical protein
METFNKIEVTGENIYTECQKEEHKSKSWHIPEKGRDMLGVRGRNGERYEVGTGRMPNPWSGEEETEKCNNLRKNFVKSGAWGRIEHLYLANIFSFDNVYVHCQHGWLSS